MKKLITIILCLVLCLGVTLGLAGCKSNNAGADGGPAEGINSDSKILIAYFTWAENTEVSDPDSIDPDATSSASVLPPGNTAKLAGWIQERVGGDLFSIVVSEPYSSDYDECIDRASEEKAAGARPELVNKLDNIDDYDVIFLGYPNWWYTAPMAIFSFIEEYDLSGKTIIPFCAHGTGGLASSVEDITSALPDSAEVLDAFGVYRPDVDSAQEDINSWLDTLGFGQAGEETGGNSDMVNGERSLVLEVGGQEMAVRLYDTPTARALYDMLPMELSFADFNSIEKIAYPPEDLPTEGEPEGCDPTTGDLCLYAPWGNLSLFYGDFRYSNGLILLGHVDGDMSLIAGMSQDFQAVLRKS